MYYPPEKLQALLDKYPNPQDPKAFEAVAVNCCNTAFIDTLESAESTSQCIDQLENLILVRINDHRPDDHVEVNVTARAGVNTVYEMNVINHTLQVSYTVTMVDEPKVVKIDWAQAVTKALRDILPDAYIRAEAEALPFVTTISNVTLPVLSTLLGDLHPDWESHITETVNNDVEIIVVVPNETRVRMVITRTPKIV